MLIELKGSSFALSVVRLHKAEPEVIRQALENKITQAPALLKHAPIVVNTSGLENPISWSALQKVVAFTGLRIIGISGCKDAKLRAEIDEMGLPLLTEGKGKVIRPTPIEALAPAASPQNITLVIKARLINVPVRFGQRIYAPQCDLIVAGYVSAGAGLTADGSVHVCGMMRGRASVGTSGDRETQVFCTHPTVKLVSIVGVYWLSDRIPVEFCGKAACPQLAENALTVQPLN